MSVQAPSPQRPRWQFGLKGLMLVMLMLVMLVAAVGAASISYLRHPATGAAHHRLVGTLMLLAAPLLLMTLVSLLRGLGRHDG